MKRQYMQSNLLVQNFDAIGNMRRVAARETITEMLFVSGANGELSRESAIRISWGHGRTSAEGHQLHNAYLRQRPDHSSTAMSPVDLTDECCDSDPVTQRLIISQVFTWMVACPGRPLVDTHCTVPSIFSLPVRVVSCHWVPSCRCAEKESGAGKKVEKKN